MNLIDLVRIELKKGKRSFILPLIFVAPLLVISSGIASLSTYFTPEYTDAWAAMFIQSALVYAYYLLPFSMIVVCVMIASREKQNNGILKMLVLPVDRKKISLAKFLVLVTYLLLEIVVFFLVFIIAGTIATRTTQVTEVLPIGYILKWCVQLFVTMLPALAAMWAITCSFERPAFSVGLNLFLVIPGVLIANTPFWVIYPYCYSGYMVSCALHDFTVDGNAITMEWNPFVPCAIMVFGSLLLLSLVKFGKKEMR